MLKTSYIAATIIISAILFMSINPATDFNWDAKYYRHAAETLIAEGSMMNYPYPQSETATMTAKPGQPFSLWPPAYPLVLAAGLLIGVDAGTTAAAINAVSLSIIVVCLWLLLEAMVVPAWARVVLVAAFLTAPMIVIMSNMALTELPFTALTCVFIWLLVTRPERLFLLTVLAGLIVTMRLVGVAVVFTGAVYYAIYLRKPLPAAFLVMGSMMPLLAWTLRNVAYTGWMFGPRYGGGSGASYAIVGYVYAMIDWMIHAAKFLVIGYIAHRGITLVHRSLMYRVQSGEYHQRQRIAVHRADQR